MSPFAVPITAFMSIAAIVILRGPLGRAIADRIAGRVGPGGTPEDQGEVLAELDEVKHRLGEVEERLDFAERLLAKQREERIGPGGGGSTA
jgi:hypothetical protein